MEPTDVSFKAATDFAKLHNFDAFLAVGGGSVIDTGKLLNEIALILNIFCQRTPKMCSIMDIAFVYKSLQISPLI